MLSREQILACQDIKIEEVPVPEWGGSVYIKVMSGAEREAWESSVTDKKQPIKGSVRASLLVQSIVDETGKKIFTEADVEELNKKSSAVLDSLFDIAHKKAKISQKDIDDLGNASQPTQ